MNRDILIELLENQDSERDDRIGTLIRLALFGLLIALRLVNFGKQEEIMTWTGWIIHRRQIENETKKNRAIW